MEFKATRTYDLNTIMPFGKYKGQTVHEVVSENAQYIFWMQRNVKGVSFTKEVMEAASVAIGDSKYSIHMNDDFDGWGDWEGDEIDPWEAIVGWGDWGW